MKVIFASIPRSRFPAISSSIVAIEAEKCRISDILVVFGVDKNDRRTYNQEFRKKGATGLRSEVLELELREEEGGLRLYDPKTGTRLRRPEESEADRLAAEAEVTRFFDHFDDNYLDFVVSAGHLPCSYPFMKFQ
ncbi:MAG: hypothetical protein ACREOO_12555 [bacterium]